jgi:hypothetical protein
MTLPFPRPRESCPSRFAEPMKSHLQFLLLTGWLIPAATALLFFGRWIIEIVIPTLKGGDFDQLYDLHQVRYLDTTLVCTAVAFVWVTFAVCRWAEKQIHSTPLAPVEGVR